MSERPTAMGGRLQGGVIIAAALFLAIGICLLKWFNIRWYWYDPPLHTYSLIVTTFILSRTFVALLYRDPPDQGALPSISIIIAVKNEQDNIAQTIRRCFQAHYPADRLEVLVVDDNSSDRTWEVLQDLRKQNSSLQIFRFYRHLGKRYAMALGAMKARGEILVYVDSDSLIEPEGLYRIVQPFSDARVGAVAGHVQVVVQEDNSISKMESVRYFVSHRIMKAAESIFGTVTCCSGAFSAYRREAVLQALPRWLRQTFLGVRATFGDDRSLTNFVLQDYRVLFHNGARAQTYVPDNWRKYFRQQLRWKKSWARETLVASRILWRKHPLAAIPYYIGVFLTLLAPLIVVRNMIYMPLFYSVSPAPYLLGLTMIYLFFCLYYLYYNRNRYWCYGLMFAGIYVTTLAWQNYYAMATVNKTHWGTR